MVREARPGDLDELLRLYLDLHEARVPEDSPALRGAWARIMADDGHHLLVDEVDGRLAASCVCVIVPNLTRGARPYALIENVVTRAGCQRQGHARACLDRAREIAAAAGCYKMMLLTGAKDAGTLRFYEKCGYNCADKTTFIQWL